MKENYSNAEITTSNLSMVMSFKYSNCWKVVFDHLRLSFNASNAVLMCRIGVKYLYTIRAVCAYAYVFRKRPGCALIGACALIRTIMVYPFSRPESKTCYYPHRRLTQGKNMREPRSLNRTKGNIHHYCQVTKGNIHHYCQVTKGNIHHYC